jgi:RNA polymerase sigma factor (sigma-70 family)
MSDMRQGPPPDPTDTLTIAERLLRDNGWSLLTPNALAQRTSALLMAMRQQSPQDARHGARPSDDMVTVATLRCYAQCLYEAFVGAQGEDQQRKAYAELLRYVYTKAGRLEPELTRDEREELACEVVAELYYRAGPAAEAGAPTVRVPGAFIAVALQQTRNAVRRWRRVARHLLQIAEENDEDPQELEDVVGTAQRNSGRSDGIYPQIERSARNAEVRAAYAQVLRRYPRANTQLQVVWMHHILELDYPAIAARLGISVESVRMLYHRGCKRLRGDPELQALADEEQLVTLRGAGHHAEPPRDKGHG